MVRKGAPVAANPDAYVRAQRSWQKKVVVALREAVRSAAEFDEVIGWGHLVYFSDGPAMLIRAEEERVIFGFFRGKRLTKIDPLLVPSGKYELANHMFRRGDEVDRAIVARLAEEAAALNRKLGDPTKIPKG